MEREYGFCNDKIFYVMQEEWIEKRDVKWDQLGRVGSVLNTWEKIKFKKILFICLCLNNWYKEQTSPRFCSLIIWTGDLAKMYCTEAPFWPAFPHLVPWKLWNGQVGGKDLKVHMQIPSQQRSGTCPGAALGPRSWEALPNPPIFTCS